MAQLGDPISDWLTQKEHKLPIGDWGEAAVDFLIEYFGWLFDITSIVLEFLVEGLVEIVLFFPALAVILALAALAYWLRRRFALAAGVAVLLLLIVNLGYWEEAVETLALVLFATSICMLIGVPVGIAAAHREWLYTILRPVLDLMQTLPTFVYLIPTLVLFGLGVVPGLISTIIFALPAPIRLTYLGVSSVPAQLREAGEAFGATKRQLLWKVEIPYAIPTIMAGLTQCIMLSLSMVVIAALVGADGLGKPVVRALNQVKIDMGIEAGLAIVILAILLDRVCRRPDMDEGGGK